METRSYKVYKFSELTDDQKQSAIENYRNAGIDYFWHSENVASLKAFADVFGIDMPNYSYGGQGDYVSFTMPEYYGDDANILEFTGIRLLKYIINNYWHEIYTPVYRGTIKHHAKHKRIRNKTGKVSGDYGTYYSGIFFDRCCPFTGYCKDDTLLGPIIDFLDSPCDNTTLEGLLQNCLDAWLSACTADYEYAYSDECIIETIEANDYDFTADGKID